MRRGFSLVEIIIAMTIALVISGVLFFTFFTNQANAEKGIETLNYIRKATILLEQLKQDIRASLHKKDSVDAKGQTVKLERHQGKKVVKVEYKFDAQNHSVIRTEDGAKKTYGSDGQVGNVVFFACDEVKKMPGFYKIEVRFETYQDRQKSGGAAADPNAPKRTANYKFEALVNKRAQENEADVKWKYAFDE
jgi:prepilin-type N-terminal cleavage/methylation domain-containing protein